MTKLGNQNLPGKNAKGEVIAFHHCKSCKEFVPFKDKHEKKIHPNGAFLN